MHQKVVTLHPETVGKAGPGNMAMFYGLALPIPFCRSPFGPAQMALPISLSVCEDVTVILRTPGAKVLIPGARTVCYFAYLHDA